MKKILVFKHVAAENLGTLKPLLANEGFRVRYVNFDREPDAKPSIEKYQGLVVLGGWMGVYEADRYPHLKMECELIEQALRREIPVLGICLGAQILAHTLGAHVRKHTEKEIGWSEVQLTKEGKEDGLLGHFRETEKVFQMHGDTFDIPAGATHLAKSEICSGQAFRYGDRAYGLQFHLEVEQGMIDRFLRVSANRLEVEEFGGKAAIVQLERETMDHLPRSRQLSTEAFAKFIGLFGGQGRSALTRSGHGKPRR